jgi:hypothetical protein
VEKLFITRQEYDKLVSENPNFMKVEYPKLSRNWKVNGVEVSGDPAIENKLRQMLGKQLATTSGRAGGYTVGPGTPVAPSGGQGAGSGAGTANTANVRPEDGFLSCDVCGGSGNCPVCHGHGTVDQVECAECGGSGECQACGGVGVMEKQVCHGKGDASMPRSFGNRVTRDEWNSEVIRLLNGMGLDGAALARDIGHGQFMYTSYAMNALPKDVARKIAQRAGSGKQLNGDTNMATRRKGKKAIDDPGEGAAAEPFKDDPEVEEKEDEAPDEAPFTAKPSAQVLAGLYRHAKAEHDYVDRAMKDLDHPVIAQALKDAYGGDDAGSTRPTMAALKDMLYEHHGKDVDGEDADSYMDKVLKAIDPNSMPVGEDNLVDAGATVDVDDQDDGLTGDDDIEAGVDDDAVVDKDDVPPATEEIEERYRMPGGKGWESRVIGRVRRVNGKAYFVPSKEMRVVHEKDLTDTGNPAELEQGDKPPQYGTIIKEQLETIKDTADYLDAAGSATDMPKAYGGPLKMYGKGLMGLHKDLSMPSDMGEGAGPDLDNPGNPAETAGPSGSFSPPNKEAPPANHKTLGDTVVGQNLMAEMEDLERVVRQRMGIRLNGSKK